MNTRRTFIKTASLLPAGLLASSTIGNLVAQEALPFNPQVGGPKLKLSLNAFSFNDLLQDYLNGRAGGMSLFELLDFCAKHDFDAIDPTGYYFPGYPNAPTDDYIYEFKRRAFRLGLDISGTGIRNDFSNPDAKARASDIARAKTWIEVSAKMGAPVLRLFAGNVPKGYENRWEDAAEWMIESFRECAEYGKKFGVIVGMQNHGEMIKTAEETEYVMKQVDSDWFGLILDTGNMKTDDPYDDIARVIPYAVNWQVKESAHGNESDIPIDLTRLMKDIKAADYRGYLPIETLKASHRPYDPYKLVPAFAKKVRAAMAV